MVDLHSHLNIQVELMLTMFVDLRILFINCFKCLIFKVTTNFDNTPLYPYTLGLFYNGQTVLNMGGSTVDEPTTVYFEF